MTSAAKEKRVTNLVMLQVKLQVVSRPGVVFSDCNSARTDAVHSVSPKIVRFDLVKQKDQFVVAPELRKFYQAEVLVPSPIPPHLILFPPEVSKQTEPERLPEPAKVFVVTEPAASEVQTREVVTLEPQASQVFTGGPPRWDCRYLKSGEWKCECGNPICVPPYTGASSSGSTGLTPLRAPKVFASRPTVLESSHSLSSFSSFPSSFPSFSSSSGSSSFSSLLSPLSSKSVCATQTNSRWEEKKAF